MKITNVFGNRHAVSPAIREINCQTKYVNLIALKQFIHANYIFCRVNKMHQGGNYQDFLKWGEVVFRSFSYNNYINLRG